MSAGTTADRMRNLRARAAGKGSTVDAHLDALADATEVRTDLDRMTTEVVVRARANGASWAAIGEALGITKQAAHMRYGQLKAR